MSYYILKSCTTPSNTIKPIYTTADIWSNIKEIKFDLKKQSGFYLPFYHMNAWLFSAEAYHIIKNYQFGQQFKPYILGEYLPDKQKIYYCLKPFELDCLHNTTKKDSSNRLIHLVLDQTKIGHHKIFHPTNILEPYLIVEIEILEKLLCAGIYPFEWEEVVCI